MRTLVKSVLLGCAVIAAGSGTALAGVIGSDFDAQSRADLFAKAAVDSEPVTENSLQLPTPSQHRVPLTIRFEIECSQLKAEVIVNGETTRARSQEPETHQRQQSDKGETRMVEAAGIEPASEDRSTPPEQSAGAQGWSIRLPFRHSGLFAKHA